MSVLCNWERPLKKLAGIIAICVLGGCSQNALAWDVNGPHWNVSRTPALSAYERCPWVDRDGDRVGYTDIPANSEQCAQMKATHMAAVEAQKEQAERVKEQAERIKRMSPAEYDAQPAVQNRYAAMCSYGDQAACARYKGSRQEAYEQFQGGRVRDCLSELQNQAMSTSAYFESTQLSLACQ